MQEKLKKQISTFTENMRTGNFPMSLAEVHPAALIPPHRHRRESDYHCELIQISRVLNDDYIKLWQPKMHAFYQNCSVTLSLGALNWSDEFRQKRMHLVGKLCMSVWILWNVFSEKSAQNQKTRKQFELSPKNDFVVWGAEG